MWKVQYIQEELKFCPRCGSEDTFASSEAEGSYFSCNPCEKNFAIREIVDPGTQEEVKTE